MGKATESERWERAFAVACDIADDFDEAVRRGLAKAAENGVDPDDIGKCFLGLYQGHYDFEAVIADHLAGGQNEDYPEDSSGEER